jgi:hypothetical protein
MHGIGFFTRVSMKCGGSDFSIDLLVDSRKRPTKEMNRTRLAEVPGRTHALWHRRPNGLVASQDWRLR